MLDEIVAEIERSGTRPVRPESLPKRRFPPTEAYIRRLYKPLLRTTT
jgi:hypothetical protein